MAEELVSQEDKREVPPLTLENVFEAVKRAVKSWWELGVYLGLNTRKLEDIRRQHDSDEARLKAVIEAFLLGEGLYQPSWRRVINALHEEGESQVAHDIESYAEAVQDPTVTVDNVTQVFNKIEGDKSKVMGENGIDIPYSVIEEIQRRYSTDKEKNKSYANYFVNYHPDASWEHLTERLYLENEFAAARESKSFMSTDPTFTVDNVTLVVKKVEPKQRQQVLEDVVEDSDVIDEIKRKSHNDLEREIAYVDVYVNCDPSSSWERLARKLYRHQQVAAVEEVKSYLPPRDLTITTDKLMDLFESANPRKVDDLGDHLDLPQSERDKIKKNYDSPTQRKEAYLDLYVHQHPCPSWRQTAEVLRYRFYLDQQADLVENTYVKGGVRDVKREIESGDEPKVMKKFGLERDDLKFICPSSILNSIAGEIIDDWPMVGQALDVSAEELKSIPQDPSHSSPKQKAVAMLDAWAKEKGREATCLKLAEALHKCKKISTLEKFCEKVKHEVEKRRDMTTSMTTLPAMEVSLSLKEQMTTTSESEIQRRSGKAEGMIPPQNTVTSLDQPVTQHHTRVKLMSSESKTETPQQSAAFQEARTGAKIPFLHHQILECDSSGGEFNIVKHDITVEIPKGCVSEGGKLCLEVGVAMYGPFKLSDNSQPISPILWLCFLNDDVQVNKPIKITVPHFLTGLTESRLQEHRVSFAKANHKDYIPQEDYIVYNFEPSEDKTQFISRKDKSYGVLETTHCCYLCIQAKMTPLLDKDVTYCLTKVERKLQGGDEIHFAATYFLDTCYEALKEQYPMEDGYRIADRKIFKFKAEALKITVPEDDDKYLVQKVPLRLEIQASNIDFWSKRRSHDRMFREDKLRIYPPRVKMKVKLKTTDSLNIIMKFSGSLNDDELDEELTFPLDGSTSQGQDHSLAATIVSPQSSSSQSIGDLCTVLRAVWAARVKWYNIGLELGTSPDTLDSIKIKCREDPDECFTEMIKGWLNKGQPPPSWTALAEALSSPMVGCASIAQELPAHTASPVSSSGPVKRMLSQSNDSETEDTPLPKKKRIERKQD